jgi:hypothetical protein
VLNGVPLAYVTITEVMVPDADDDPEDGYLMVEKEIIHRAPHSGPAFSNERRTVWDIMSKFWCQHECWIHIKNVQKAKDRKRAHDLLVDHSRGPNNVGNMASAAET